MSNNSDIEIIESEGNENEVNIDFVDKILFKCLLNDKYVWING